MLKKYSQIFLSALVVSDSLLIAISWLGSYYLRFFSGWWETPLGVPPLDPYLNLIFPVVVLFLINYKVCGLYHPLRGKSVWFDIFKVIKVNLVSSLLLTSLLFFYRDDTFSRLTVLLFFISATVLIVTSHSLIRLGLMALRRTGRNLRHVLVVGTGSLAQDLVRRFELHPEMGFHVVGFIGEFEKDRNTRVKGYPVVGLDEDIPNMVKDRKIDHLFVSLPLKDQARLEKTLASLKDAPVDIKVIPDLFRFMSLRGGVDDFDGLPVVNLSESPLYGWNIVVKRASDIIISTLILALIWPLLVLIGYLVKRETTGSILFRQERMGLDGKLFKILKFRTMREDAEQQTGPVWAQAQDNRVTRIGKILRKTSMDELPQLWNVLRGDMSLVGPRPERPVFVEDFRKSVPQYMYRTRMKAGMTGWAQVNGWRGNTSIEKRIEHDIYYIQHWSWFFDMKILVMTFWKGLIHKNAY